MRIRSKRTGAIDAKTSHHFTATPNTVLFFLLHIDDKVYSILFPFKWFTMRFATKGQLIIEQFQFCDFFVVVFVFVCFWSCIFTVELLQMTRAIDFPFGGRISKWMKPSNYYCFISNFFFYNFPFNDTSTRIEEKKKSKIFQHCFMLLASIADQYHARAAIIFFFLSRFFEWRIICVNVSFFCVVKIKRNYEIIVKCLSFCNRHKFSWARDDLNRTKQFFDDVISCISFELYFFFLSFGVSPDI